MKKGISKQRLIPGLVSCFILIAVNTTVHAKLPLNLTGNVDISYSESEVDNSNQETFQQKYSLNWTKNFFSNVMLRSSYNYDKANLTQTSRDQIWQERQTPFVDLIWNSSYFTTGVNYHYNVTNSDQAALQLTRKSLGAQFKTKSITYPTVTLRYNRDHTYNHKDLTYQNYREERYQAELHHSIQQSMFYYGFSHRDNDNEQRNLQSVQNSHIVRLSTLKNFSEKLRISSNYSFTYKNQKDTRETNTFDYFVLQIRSALYNQTSNLLLDSLSSVAELNDGNTKNVVLPLLDLGGSEINQNIGVDFGFQQQISALYLYINQYTDKQSMQIYISDDNLIWELYYANPNIVFNSVYSRLEITFPEVETRYIKVVNLDVSDIEHAYLTEIEALEGRAIAKTSKTESSSHLIDMLAKYSFSKKVSTSLDASYQHLPGQFGGITRDNLNYALTTRYTQSDKLSHSMRFQNNYQLFHGLGQDVVTYSAYYLLSYKPLQKLEFTLSPSMLLDYIAEMKNTDIQSVVLGTKGTPIPGMTVSIRSTYSHNNQHLAKQLFNSWAHMFNIDAGVTKSLSLSGDYIHRSTNFKETANTITEKDINSDQYLFGIRYRISKTIFLRSSYVITNNINKYDSQTYMLSWNPSSKLSLSGQIRLQNNDDTVKTKRYNAQLSYSLSRNSNIYVSYLVNDLSQDDDDQNESLRIGFRSGL